MIKKKKTIKKWTPKFETLNKLNKKKTILHDQFKFRSHVVISFSRLQWFSVCERTV